MAVVVQQHLKGTTSATLALEANCLDNGLDSGLVLFIVGLLKSTGFRLITTSLYPKVISGSVLSWNPT